VAVAATSFLAALVVLVAATSTGAAATGAGVVEVAGVVFLEAAVALAGAAVLVAVELIMLAAEEVLEDMERGMPYTRVLTGLVKFVTAGAKSCHDPHVKEPKSQ
jgi:hypothetical protein